jgi:hypothetical protein
MPQAVQLGSDKSCLSPEFLVFCTAVEFSSFTCVEDPRVEVALGNKQGLGRHRSSKFGVGLGTLNS